MNSFPDQLVRPVLATNGEVSASAGMAAVQHSYPGATTPVA